MPKPIAVELQPHDPTWAESARRETGRLGCALGENLVTVHLIGSTAVPNNRAKPILDLLPVLLTVAALDDVRPALESLGYEWWGEYGRVGRRYCTIDKDGRRIVQLHCYEQESLAIQRHLAFRDYLRSRPNLARQYDAEKARCCDLHPMDSHAYTDCKDAWIRQIEAQALSEWLTKPL